MTDSISVMLDLDELELLYNMICEELEFQEMDYDEDVVNMLAELKTKLLQKRVFLLKES